MPSKKQRRLKKNISRGIRKILRGKSTFSEIHKSFVIFPDYRKKMHNLARWKMELDVVRDYYFLKKVGRKIKEREKKFTTPGSFALVSAIRRKTARIDYK